MEITLETKKEFVPYTEALELKELGFDEPCFGYYVEGQLRGINLGIEELGGVKPYYQRFGFHTISNHDIDNTNKVVVTAPLYQQSFKFFREKYFLVIQYIPYEIDDSEGQSIIHHKYKISEYDSWRGGRRNTVETELNEDYEEAELECLKKLIEIVKERNE
jgi:hypothetical protein